MAIILHEKSILGFVEKHILHNYAAPSDFLTSYIALLEASPNAYRGIVFPGLESVIATAESRKAFSHVMSNNAMRLHCTCQPVLTNAHHSDFQQQH